jgi:hypothetical protein
MSNKEFNLQKLELKVIVDGHLEIGRGWSEEFE